MKAEIIAVGTELLLGQIVDTNSAYMAQQLTTIGLDLHFKSMADVLLDDSAPLVGKYLKYLHDDSWEVGLPNWTRGFLDEFKKYRGYDALPYLPALAGHTVGSPEISDQQQSSKTNS